MVRDRNSAITRSSPTSRARPVRAVPLFVVDVTRLEDSSRGQAQMGSTRCRHWPRRDGLRIDEAAPASGPGDSRYAHARGWAVEQAGGEASESEVSQRAVVDV